jgi:hypothetical protein
MDTNLYTIPSLQGTLAKRTKPSLKPNFAKEPFHPSRAIKRTERQWLNQVIVNVKEHGQRTTRHQTQ